MGFALAVLALAVLWQPVTSDRQRNNVQELQRQELLFELLWDTNEVPKNHPEVFERIKTYKIEDVATACHNKVSLSRFRRFH